MSDPILRALVDLRDRQIQKARIQFNNRLAALDNETDDAADSPQRQIVARWLERFTELEEELDRDIARAVKVEPVFQHVSALKGVGPLLSAKLIAMIDIERAPTVSALWRYAGYAVVDGERERPQKGEKLHYNIRLKTTCYLIGTSFLKCSSPYRAVYDAARVRYETDRPDWTKAHQHAAAMRKMIKVFLSHFWERARTLEGLPTRGLYVHEYEGHTSAYKAEEFGWPTLEAVAA